LLSKEEKKKQRLAKEKLEQMRAQGLVVPNVDKSKSTAEAGQVQAAQGEEKGKERRPVYGKKKKKIVPNQKEPNKDAVTTKETTAAPPSAVPQTDTPIEKTATPVEVKKEEESKKKETPPQEDNELSWEDVDDPDELEKQKQKESENPKQTEKQKQTEKNRKDHTENKGKDKEVQAKEESKENVKGGKDKNSKGVKPTENKQQEKKKVVDPRMPQTVTVSSQPKDKTGMWECLGCTYRNLARAGNCVVCTTIRYQDEA